MLLVLVSFIHISSRSSGVLIVITTVCFPPAKGGVRSTPNRQLLASSPRALRTHPPLACIAAAVSSCCCPPNYLVPSSSSISSHLAAYLLPTLSSYPLPQEARPGQASAILPPRSLLNRGASSAASVRRRTILLLCPWDSSGLSSPLSSGELGLGEDLVGLGQPLAGAVGDVLVLGRQVHHLVLVHHHHGSQVRAPHRWGLQQVAQAHRAPAGPGPQHGVQACQQRAQCPLLPVVLRPGRQPRAVPRRRRCVRARLVRCRLVPLPLLLQRLSRLIRQIALPLLHARHGRRALSHVVPVADAHTLDALPRRRLG
mmetsp:Transcript_9052/g.15176  ORF Transcript_9052/g.15176 Transcript_9052/m.15176 type:complete len:313 (-) Transcript_9052:37-975(-)